MKVVKVRRVGNSNVISIPREFEAQGYAPGSSVLVEELPGGELRIMSTDKVRERIHEIGERVVAEHGEALQILADHDGRSPSGAARRGSTRRTSAADRDAIKAVGEDTRATGERRQP